MVLDESSFLNILLGNPEIQRLSRMLAKRETNNLFLFRTSGVSPQVLLSLASQILIRFRGHERLLTQALGEEVKIGTNDSTTKNFSLDLSNKIEDPESLFPIGWGISLYRDEKDLHATVWK